MPYTQTYILKRTLLVVMILVGLGAAIYPGLAAQAGTRQCVSDPMIYLTDGSAVTLSARIGTDAAYIQKITFTLHVPRGNGLKAVVNTVGDLGAREVVAVVADNDPGVYTSSTLVSVIATQVTVTSSLALTDTQAASVRGYSNQRLVVSLQ